MDWARILAYITGTVDQELLLRSEYLFAENRILKAQLPGRLRLSDAERAHDRDAKYSASFRAIIETGHVKTVVLPARSPNLNAYAERWIRSAKEECLSKIILFGERSLRRTISDYVEHYHTERNHQGKSNVLLFFAVTETPPRAPFAVASGWEGCCVFTIKRLPKRLMSSVERA